MTSPLKPIRFLKCPKLLRLPFEKVASLLKISKTTTFHVG
jgi:hypothetical protein